MDDLLPGKVLPTLHDHITILLIGLHHSANDSRASHIVGFFFPHIAIRSLGSAQSTSPSSSSLSHRHFDLGWTRELLVLSRHTQSPMSGSNRYRPASPIRKVLIFGVTLAASRATLPPVCRSEHGSADKQKVIDAKQRVMHRNARLKLSKN